MIRRNGRHWLGLRLGHHTQTQEWQMVGVCARGTDRISFTEEPVGALPLLQGDLRGGCGRFQFRKPLTVAAAKQVNHISRWSNW